MSGALIAELLASDVYNERTIVNWKYSKVGNHILFTYPSNTIEEQSYRRGDNSEVLRLRITYTNSSKTQIERVERIA